MPFFANKIHEERLLTAESGNFDNGFRRMRYDDLHPQVEGYTELMTLNLRELDKHRDALEAGKQVAVHFKHNRLEGNEVVNVTYHDREEEL